MDFDAGALIASLPGLPGVYRMLDGEGRVLYVGKAKNLRKRVSSYFQRGQLGPRIQMMVAQVAAVETTVTRSEGEALLLENNLIKSLQPRFNILFRDDKSYPFIMLSADPCPRLGFHRGGFAKGARYFGPFPNASAVRDSLQLLQKMFRLRVCENAVFENRSRPCLLHQIRRCTAPCVGLIDRESYAQDVRLAEMFLLGRYDELIDRLTAQMHEAAAELAFERAAALRDQVRTLTQVLQRQYVDSGRDEDADVLVAAAQGGEVCVNIAMVRGGRHLGDRPQFPHNGRDCGADEALAAFVGQHYAEHPAPPRLILTDDPTPEIEEALAALGERRPQAARARNERERAWADMALRNAQLALATRLADSTRTGQRLDALAAALELDEPPRRIECFDVSHTMGEAPVASCVVFVDGRAHKAEYRRYNIAGITPGDDYAAMRQALTRRYEKVVEGQGLRPDLVLIDGGRGQLAIAHEVCAELGLDVMLVGVAKGEARKPGLEELVFAGGRAAMRLAVSDPGLHLIQEIRDEAHRFAITGHRARRARTRRESGLEDVPGVGPTRRRKLLARFGGLQGVLAASIDDLSRVEGISRELAERIYNQLH